MSNLPQRPGESLAAWGTRLQAADAQLAAQQKQGKARRKGPSGQPFGQLHPRGRGGQFAFKQGDSGAEVSGIQHHVNAPATGRFDRTTAQAVTAFQRQHGLKVDAVVGAQTVAAMRGRKNASAVKPGMMSGADRAWLLKQVLKPTRQRKH